MKSYFMSKENFEKINEEKEITEKDIDKFIEIANSQNFDIQNEDLTPFEKICTSEDIKQTRAALATLYPDMKLPNDENIYEHIKNETKFLREEEYNPVRNFNNAIWTKIIYPEHYEKIYDDNAQAEIFEYLKQQMEIFRDYNYTHELYNSLRDLKILFPNIFNTTNISEILLENGWKDKIYMEIDYIKLRNEHPEETLADFVASVNFVGYPNKLEVDEKHWNKFKKACKQFKEKGTKEYPYLAEYLANLKIIAASNINVTNRNIQIT